MLTNLPITIALSIAEIICILLVVLLKRETKKSTLKSAFLFLSVSMLICCTGTLLQNFLSKPLNIDPVYFEYLTYIGNVTMSIGILLVGLIYNFPNFKFKKIHSLILVIPIISLILLWTNDLHHLFYKEYSINLTQTTFGNFFAIYNIYSLVLIGIGIVSLLVNIVKSSTFFSKQTMLVLLAILIPISVNIMTTLKLIDSTIYITPITFSFSILLLFLSIFKFQFLNITPIAIQRIVDRISDSYIILNTSNVITDYNKTFLTTFKIKNISILRGNTLEDFLRRSNLYFELKKLKDLLKKIQTSQETFSYELYVKKLNKYFNVEVSSIFSNGQSIGSLILFKDISQHKKDIQKLKNTQESLMESERLSSLGQLIGGIAHNLKTPIMSISGAAEGLTDLIKEYDESIEDPTVNAQDHHEIASDMSKWVVKIKEYTEYMSDVITAVKGQAVAMSNEDEISFTVGELVKRVNILMKHELKNAIVTLNVLMNVEENLAVHGDVNNLVQVINNMISNAIQAYNGEPEKTIEFAINKENNNVIFSIEDHAGGLPEKVKEKLFKEMITTKGKNGTGLGLYMSYSTIKAHFNGTISYKTETGIGTTFYITIPLK